MSAEDDFVVADSNGTVHILNIDADNQSVNTIENAHAVRYLLIIQTLLCLKSSTRYNIRQTELRKETK